MSPHGAPAIRDVSVAGGHFPFGSHSLLFSSMPGVPRDAAPGLLENISSSPLPPVGQRWSSEEDVSNSSSSRLLVGAAPKAALYAGPPKVACVTILRDPLHRLVSCYYFRFYKAVRRRLDEFPPEVLHRFFRHAKDEFGHSCLNEHLRIFSGSVDEDRIGAADRGSEFGERMTLEAATRNLPQCVVLSLSDWKESAERVKHYFPWVKANALVVSHENNNGAVKGKPRSLQESRKMNRWQFGSSDLFGEAQVRVLRELVDLEMRFYKYGLRLFEFQSPSNRNANSTVR